jgi:hypothetical protein
MRRTLRALAAVVLLGFVLTACGSGPLDAEREKASGEIVETGKTQWQLIIREGPYFDRDSSTTGYLLITRQQGEDPTYTRIRFQKQPDGSWAFGCLDTTGKFVDLRNPQLTELFNKSISGCPVGFTLTTSTP